MMLKFSSQKSDNAPFSEESYKSLMPFLSNINSYLQTFLSVFSSSMMALNGAIITVILSREASFSRILFGFGVGAFLGAIVLYMGSFRALTRLRQKLLEYSKSPGIKFEEISHTTETEISLFIFRMKFSAIVFLICFIFLFTSARP